MTVPYAPTPISPIAGAGARVDPFTFRARNNGSDTNHATAYLLERQRLSPTLGVVEYYDADVGGGTFVTPAPAESDTISEVEGGEIFEVSDSSGDWDGDAVYQWRIKFMNATGWSEYSPWSIFVARHSVWMTPRIEDPSTDSRPVVRWTLHTLEGAYDVRAFRLAVWRTSDLPAFGYSVDDPAIYNLAIWAMDDWESYGPVVQKRLGVDLESGVNYTVAGKLLDKYGVEHIWNLVDFDTSFTAPNAPILTVIPDPTNGIMRIIVDAAFNLADIDSSTFDDGVGLWVNSDNAEITHQNIGGYMEVLVIGATYAQMDAAQTTYAAEDAAYGTYEDQRLVRTTFTGGARVWYADPYTGWIPALAATNYSAIISVFPVGTNITAELVLRYYTAAGAFISESVVTPVNCISNSWTEVGTGALTTPANTAFIRPTLELNAGVDTVIKVDNFAIARSNEVVWSPGGSSADVQINLSRKVGSGDWEYVWGASRDNPKVPESSVYSVAQVDDRAYPIGTDEDVTYRAVIVSEATGKTVASALTEAAAPSMNVEAWWLRCVDGTLPDVRLRTSDFSKTFDPSNQVFGAQGQDYGTVVDSGDAPGRQVRVSGNLFDVGEYSAMEALLESGKVLYIQRNIGDGFYIKPTGGVQVTQRIAKATSGRVRHFHNMSFNAEIVAIPEDLVQ